VTGGEYREIRNGLGWSQHRLAEALGIHRQTVAKRELGTLPIDREAEYALLYVVERNPS